MDHVRAHAHSLADTDPAAPGHCHPAGYFHATSPLRGRWGVWPGLDWGVWAGGGCGSAKKLRAVGELLILSKQQVE